MASASRAFDPLATRMSAYFVPGGQFVYSTQLRASSGVPVPSTRCVSTPPPQNTMSLPNSRLNIVMS